MFALALAASAALARPAAAQAAKLDDPTIVAIFDAANTWDIATGELGAKKGTTKEIREYLSFLTTVANSLRFLWTPSEERPPLSPS